MFPLKPMEVVALTLAAARPRVVGSLWFSAEVARRLLLEGLVTVDDDKYTATEAGRELIAWAREEREFIRHVVVSGCADTSYV